MRSPSARAAGHRVDQPRPPVRRAGPDAGRLVEHARGGARRSSPDHLSLYALTLDDPDAEGLTGPTATTCRRAAARAAGGSGPRPAQDEDRAAGACTSSPTSASPRPGFGVATRSATGRGPGHESRHNLAYWQRRAVRGRRARAPTPSTARPGAGTPRASTATSRPCCPPDGARPWLPPGGAETARSADRGAEAAILGAPDERGLPLPPSHEPRSATRSAGRSTPSCSTSTADRIVLTTRGPAALERAVRPPRLRLDARRPRRVDTRRLGGLRSFRRVSTLAGRVLTTGTARENRPWRVESVAPPAPWTFAHRRSSGPSSRNTSPPPRRSAARRSSTGIGSACPARRSATSSPSSSSPASSTTRTPRPGASRPTRAIAGTSSRSSTPRRCPRSSS